MHDITRDCIAMDEKKDGQVDARDFMRVLETRVKSSEVQKAHKELLVDYVLGFSDPDTGMVRYLDMLGDLKAF